MTDKPLILAQTICTHYEIEVSFIDELYRMGLINIEVIEQNQFIHQDQVGDLERMIRLHHELNLNLEGIDVVLNLLEKEKNLRQEVIALTNRLRIYEGE